MLYGTGRDEKSAGTGNEKAGYNMGTDHRDHAVKIAAVLLAALLSGGCSHASYEKITAAETVAETASDIVLETESETEFKTGSETGDILGCNATGEKILTTTGYGNLNVRSSNLSGREPLIDFARNQIYQRIRRGDSIVIIDPERRLHTREMWIYLTIHGYCVDSYDLDCMDGSCCFNCLSGFDKKLRKEDLDLIQRIANDIINDQRHNVPFAVDKISKILLSAVMIAVDYRDGGKRSKHGWKLQQSFD